MKGRLHDYRFVWEVLKQAYGVQLEILFLKKNTNEHRLMLCEMRVDEVSVKPPSNKIALVYDLEKKKPRSFSLDRVIHIKANGHLIEHDPYSCESWAIKIHSADNS